MIEVTASIWSGPSVVSASVQVSHVLYLATALCPTWSGPADVRMVGGGWGR